MKSVGFAPFSRLAVFSGPEESLTSKLHYSRHEVEAMRVSQARAILDAREWYTSVVSSNSPIVPDNAPDLTGLERFLTQASIRNTAARKERRLRAVLLEQARQHATGEHNLKRLSLASQRYSERSVQQAKEIAALTEAEVSSEG